MRTWNPVEKPTWPIAEVSASDDGGKPSPRSAASKEKIRLTCRFISPVMGGGVDPKKYDEVTPVRVSSLRGQLRFWWRATQGHLSLDELRRRERLIFGGVHGKEVLASLVSIRVIKQPGAPRRLAVFEQGNAFKLAAPGLEELAYGAFPLRGTDASKTHDLLFDYRDTFELELSLPKTAEEKPAKDQFDVRKNVEQALWAWLHFGGFGGRVRRGFGAVELVSSGEWTLPTIEQGWPSAPGWRKEAEWPVLGPTAAGCVVRAQSSFASGLDAQKKLLGLLRRLRQGDLGRNPTSARDPKRPGRSYWPEPDAIRDIYAMKGGPHDKPQHSPRINTFPRGAFGAPIIFHFKTEQGEREPPDTTLVPTRTVWNEKTNRAEAKELSRLASALVLRPHASGRGQYEALALHLHQPRPDGWALLERNKPKQTGLLVSLTTEQAARITPLLFNSTHAANAVEAYLARLRAL